MKQLTSTRDLSTEERMSTMAKNLVRRIASLETTKSDAIVLTLIERVEDHSAPGGLRMFAHFGSKVHHSTEGESESAFYSRLTALAEAERRSGTGPVRIIVRMEDVEL